MESTTESTPINIQLPNDDEIRYDNPPTPEECADDAPCGVLTPEGWMMVSGYAARDMWTNVPCTAWFLPTQEATTASTAMDVTWTPTPQGPTITKRLPLLTDYSRGQFRINYEQPSDEVPDSEIILVSDTKTWWETSASDAKLNWNAHPLKAWMKRLPIGDPPLRYHAKIHPVSHGDQTHVYVFDSVLEIGVLTIATKNVDAMLEYATYYAECLNYDRMTEDDIDILGDLLYAATRPTQVQ